VNLLETVALVVIGNAFFLAAVVYLPLNLGRVLLQVGKMVVAGMSLEEQVLMVTALVGPQAWAWSRPWVGAVLSMLGAVEYDGGKADLVTVAWNATAAYVALGSATAAAGAAEGQSGIAGPGFGSLQAAPGAAVLGSAPAPGVEAAGLMAYPLEPFPMMTLTLEQLLRELQAQVELPAKSDLLALSLGHGMLAMLCMLCLWTYASMRLWKAHSRRTRGGGRQPPVLQVSLEELGGSDG
jgi:hypothetical protein